MEDYREEIERIANMEDKEAYDRGLDANTARVAIQYYPYTDRCPVDGRSCDSISADKCPWRYKHKPTNECLLFEVQEIWYEVFNTNRRFISEQNADWIGYYLSCNRAVVDMKENKTQWVVEIAGNEANYYVLRKVVEDLGYIDLFEDCTCGGLVYKDKLSCMFENLRSLKEIFLKMKEIIDKLLPPLVEAHRCIECGKVKGHEGIFKYDVFLCEECKDSIIDDYIKHHVNELHMKYGSIMNDIGED